MVRHGEEVAAWALPCGDSEEGEDHFAKTPPTVLNSLQKGPSADFNDLKKGT